MNADDRLPEQSPPLLLSAIGGTDCNGRNLRGFKACSDRVYQVDEIIFSMPPLGSPAHIAFPFQRNVEPWEMTLIVKPSEPACATLQEQMAGFRMLAQINRQIKPAHI